MCLCVEINFRPKTGWCETFLVLWLPCSAPRLNSKILNFPNNNFGNLTSTIFKTFIGKQSTILCNTFTTSIDVFARKCQRQARSHVLHDFLVFDQSKRFCNIYFTFILRAVTSTLDIWKNSVKTHCWNVVCVPWFELHFSKFSFNQ